VGVAAVVPGDPRTSATRWIQNPQQEQDLALLVTWLARAAPRGPDGYALRVLRGAALAASAALRAGLSMLRHVITRAFWTAPDSDESAHDEAPVLAPLKPVTGAVSSPVTSGADTATAEALRAALAAGNPPNMNQLQGRFRLTRNEATQARRDGAWCQEPKSSDPGRRPTGSLTTSPPRQRPASSRYRYWRPFRRDPKLSRTPA
jgi:hypothetical protein